MKSSNFISHCTSNIPVTMSDGNEEMKKQAIASLERMQNFDPITLARKQELGEAFHFGGVIPAAKNLIGIYKNISQRIFDDLADDQLSLIINHADSDYSKFQQILEFSPTLSNATAVREQLSTNILSGYDCSFRVLMPYITYSTCITVDFQRLETEARAHVQRISDLENEFNANLQKKHEESKSILEDIRRTAAEQGVSQQAIYFKEESDIHKDLAKKWLKWVIVSACILLIYTILTTFAHKLPCLVSQKPYDMIQLALSKMLIFAVLSYILYFSVKNYMASNHNTVVNKHRQNALLTFNALVDAARDSANHDIVLTNVSACIFSPQLTGYIGSSMDSASAESIVKLFPTISTSAASN